MSLYVVKQKPVSGSWEHYLCGWWGRHNDIPVLLSDRSQALKLDAKEAAECVKRLDARYRYPASGLRHSVEELSDD